MKRKKKYVITEEDVNSLYESIVERERERKPNLILLILGFGFLFCFCVLYVKVILSPDDSIKFFIMIFNSLEKL